MRHIMKRNNNNEKIPLARNASSSSIESGKENGIQIRFDSLVVL